MAEQAFVAAAAMGDVNESLLDHCKYSERRVVKGSLFTAA